MTRLGDDERDVLGGEPWPGPARALIDLYASRMTSLEIVGVLSTLVDEHELNILSLGPPLRLQVPTSAMVAVMDAVEYERVKILHWPFSASRPKPDTRALAQGLGDD